MKWASVSGDVFFFDPELDRQVHESYMIQIIECKTFPVAGDPTGQLAAGYIRIRGWLKTLRGLSLTYEPGETILWVYWGGEAFNDAVAEIRFDENEFFAEADLSVLPMLESRQTPLDDSETVIRGLLLTNTGKEDQYRRVGTFQSRPEKNSMFRRSLYPLDDTLDLPIGKLSLDEKKINLATYPKPACDYSEACESTCAHSSLISRTRILPELDEWVERIIEII
jgi:hypothetical protein